MGAAQSSAEAPTISVCIGCYNQRRYLGKCLDSIVAQKIDVPVEILVGDDASTDGTAELVEDYARRDARIVPIRRRQNLGFLENHRDLFARTRGEFVAICDGDDFWTDPDKLAKQLAAMQSDPRLTLAISAGQKVSESGEQPLGLLQIGGPSRELGLAEMIAAVTGVPTASMFMRREALMALPAETYEQPVLDYSFQVFLAARGPVWYDSSVTCAYRVSSIGSWTESLASSPERYQQRHEAFTTYQDFLESELDARWTPALRRASEPITLGFYMSSRVNRSEKIRSLSKDLPRLSGRGRVIAKILAYAPVLVQAGAIARRRIWSPLARRMRKSSRA
jgi:glycosyltransferase involved in cell wall biosynthesis